MNQKLLYMDVPGDLQLSRFVVNYEPLMLICGQLCLHAMSGLQLFTCIINLLLPLYVNQSH